MPASERDALGVAEGKLKTQNSKLKTNFSLYIHIPWCVKKCPYCDFNSHQRTQLPKQEYFNALKADFDNSLKYFKQRKLKSIFIGGGTPSLIEAQYYQQLFEHISSKGFDLTNIEITIEANPGTIDNANLKGYYAIGINRLSLGVQSFNDLMLQRLGRIHSADTVKYAIGEAIAAGFNNINLDLIYGLPGQTIDDALADLTVAFGFPIQHLSWYNLTIEPNTEFYSMPPKLPNADIQYQMYMQGSDFISNKGFNRYEISAFATAKSRQCQHNLAYWQYNDYLGIGAGAHSKITDAVVSRFNKLKQPESYINNRDKVNFYTVTTDKIVFDIMLNCMCLITGFDYIEICKFVGISEQKFITTLKPLFDNNFITKSGSLLIPTEQGINFQNEALVLLLD